VREQVVRKQVVREELVWLACMCGMPASKRWNRGGVMEGRGVTL
jgi:hypothetical protein